MTGTGYFANVIVPVEVSLDLNFPEHVGQLFGSFGLLRCAVEWPSTSLQGAEPGLDLLAPLVDQADLPTEAGGQSSGCMTKSTSSKLLAFKWGVAESGVVADFDITGCSFSK